MQQNHPADPLYNLGTGEDITIRDLAVLIKDVVGYDGDIVFDASFSKSTGGIVEQKNEPDTISIADSGRVIGAQVILAFSFQ